MSPGRLLDAVEELNWKGTLKSGASQSFEAFMEGELGGLTVDL